MRVAEWMRVAILTFPAVLVCFVLQAGARASALNERVLAAISEMPEGGDYAVNRTASAALTSAVEVRNGILQIQPVRAQPSYCSGATYLVFLMALEAELRKPALDTCRDALLSALRVSGQADGVGVWGRWNANGPGTAKLFRDAGIGRSFWGYEEAPLPGDFLKLWWKDAIGKDEHGHSVVFLDYTVSAEGEKGILAWSSNKPGGYGKKFFPFQKIRHALFSRCEHPERIQEILKLPVKDSMLADMLRKNFLLREVKTALTAIP